MKFNRQQRTVQSGDDIATMKPQVLPKTYTKGKKYIFLDPLFYTPRNQYDLSKSSPEKPCEIRSVTSIRLPPLKDLTHYGVEPNPGPMATIQENGVYIPDIGTFQYCFNCENATKLLSTTTKFVFYTNNCKLCLYKPQSQILSEESINDVHNRMSSIKNWLLKGDKHGKSFSSHYMAIPSDVDTYINLLEDVAILAHDFIYSTSLANRYIAIISFCKRRGSRIGFSTSLMYIAADLFGSQTKSTINIDEKEILDRINYSPQSDSPDNIFAEARAYVNCYEKMKETPIYKKLYKFLLYILSMGLLDGVKIDFDSLNFNSFEAKCIKATHKPGLDMIHCFLDTILFVCDKGYQYLKTGDSEVFLHSGSSYDKWITKANKLLCDAKFLNNPEPLGINKFSFLSELKDCIEKGASIVRFTSGMDKHEKLYVTRVLNDLRMLEAEQITRKSAQMPRKDPFAVLIHGSSSICKSQLKQILFYHYGKVFDLPTTADYMYTRCPTDEYWSGFNSTQWCVVMDDIAFLKPNGEVDPTLKEMLQVKNSVPYTPPQASLEDKGRTPVRAELLIGTTNTKHLNLYAYFACPFAIARRMSYVITARVKPEYTKHKFMADSNKIPITPDGEYMNIWNFDVAIPVPQSDIEIDNQQSKYTVIKVFTDINDLLVWYIQAAKEHEASQIKALSADKVMCDVEVCKSCYRSNSQCVCFAQQNEVVIDTPEEVDITSGLSNFFHLQLMLYQYIILGLENDELEWYLLVKDFLYLNINPYFGSFFSFYLFALFPFFTFTLVFTLIGAYLLHRYIWVILHAFCAYTGGVMWKYRLLFRITNNSEETYRLLLRYAGQRIKTIHFTDKKLQRLAMFLAGPMILLTLRKMYNSYLSKPTSDPTTNKLCKRCKSDCYCDQGNDGSVPVNMETEKPTFYYNNPYVNTDVEISGASKCAQGDLLSKRVKQATAKFKFEFPDTPGKYSAGVGINIHGNLWMLNKHVVKSDFGSFDVIRDPTNQNCSRNMYKITFCKGDVFRVPNSDLTILRIRALAPGHNLIKYFPLKDMLKGCYSGRYNLITKEGDRSVLEISNIRGFMRCPVFGVPGYFARVPQPTQVGDCGALCIANIGTSQVLLGVHTAGSPDNGIFFQHVSQEMLKQCLQSFEPQIETGTIPISVPGYERKLVDLHPKSTLRFLESGTVHIMGSFTGYRPKHKSRVKETHIVDYVVQHGYKADYGPPDMTWKPWHLAIKDMVAPQYTFDNDTLDQCEDAFFEDICVNLGDKVNQLQVYTQDVALNGVDGVTFVDMLNTSTSAGNPFKKSKKHFITLTQTGKIESLDPLITDRIKQIEDCYDNGIRFHPQFCGHSKDEALPWRKVHAGKTRIFTGGEFAWSVVVRRYLLSHIRLIQNNPYAFEAMPGIVAQSKEWGTLHKYLTKFGEHKIIAGDYGKFDKKMAAAFILSAFRILERLAKRAGWPDSDLQYIRCIANDTAFPSIDFNGDLIEIQGNPSGHPLTVIINCLVNSLYMRYAFKHISHKPLKHFRKYVNLATYGDDNIMGVSDDCPDFNHTRISVIMKLIGVDYTMAEKEAQSIPYIHINDSSFLKRKFVYDSDAEAIVCPLDHASIDKMLTARLDEGVLDSRAHSICVIETALREYFFYGKEKFEDRLLFFKTLVQECNLQDWVEKSTFPSYEQLKLDFHERLSTYPDHNIDTWQAARE